MGFPSGSDVKNLPAKQKMQVWSLEEEMATHTSIPAWEIQWTEEPCRLQAKGLQRVGEELATKQQQKQQCYM